MPPKTAGKKNDSLWSLCDSCGAKVPNKDLEVHASTCNTGDEGVNHSFVRDGVLYGNIDLKANEEVKGVTQHDKDNMVFLSQSAIQLCGLSIGEYAGIEFGDGSVYGRMVWPTIEKSVSSVLFTKNSLEMMNAQVNNSAKVWRLKRKLPAAKNVHIVVLNAPKSLELTPELRNKLHRSYLERPLATGNILGLLFYGKMLWFEVKKVESDFEEDFSELNVNDDVNNNKFYQVVENTSFVMFMNNQEYKSETITKNPFNKIGGLTTEITELSDLIACNLGSKPTIRGLRATRAILLYGSSGTGKTLLMNAFASTLPNINKFHINPAALYGKLAGNADENVREIFKEARDRAPSLILMDEVDVLCPTRSARMVDSEKRMVSCLLTQFDELEDDEEAKVFVIGATNKVDCVDAAFRRCGRFEREIEVPVPNPKARYEILQKLLSEASLELNLLSETANNTHGFVGADLVALCSRAALQASRHNRNQLLSEDFKFALTRVRPSAMREVQIEVPNVKWSDIGGQEHLKLVLKQCVEWPLKHAESFIRMGITPPRGVLMYGPPGCSKTMIAKALATESKLNFLSIKGPELFSKWVGESERAVREVFRKARQVAPSIVFFDEIDALGGERSSGVGSSSVQERVLAQLLTELDGVTPLGDVTVLAATNRPDRIDKALLRPGRLDRIVYVPPPDAETRMEIFKIKLKKMPVQGVMPETLVSLTDGYSGAEVNAVCHEAAMAALEEDLNADTVEVKHFQKALQLVTPRTPKSLLRIYDEYRSNL